jgi:hypothetical protein
MGDKREPEERKQQLTAKERKAALRRRGEILEALLEALRGH